MATKIKWEEANFKWNENPHKWDEVLLVEEVAEAIEAGAGIVADSKPLKEYEETVNKAKALINALK